MISILIVDRNPHVREFLQRELQHQGYAVLAAGSAGDMLAYLAGSAAPGIVVLDPDLPDQGGLPLIKRLRREFPDVCLVVHAHGGEGGLDRSGAPVVEKDGRTGPLLEAVRLAARDCAGLVRENGTEPRSGREGRT